MEISRKIARKMMRKLALGIPPTEGLMHYSSRNLLRFVDEIVKDLPDDIEDTSVIKFIYGGYGSGKSHILKLFQELLLDENFAVCFIEVKNEDPIFSSQENLAKNVLSKVQIKNQIEEGFMRMIKMIDKDGIKIDQFIENTTFNQSIHKDFLIISEEIINANPRNDRVKIDAISKWINGGADLRSIKKILNVSDLITKANGENIITTFAKLITNFGYAGLAIIIDEAEKLSSSFTKQKARHAFGNLKSMINSLDGSPGTFFLFATTPDFFGKGSQLDRKVNGIQLDHALQSRLGEVPNSIPLPQQPIWNIEFLKVNEKAESEIWDKIINMYCIAYDVTIDDPLYYKEIMMKESANLVTFRIKIKFLIQLLDKILQRIDKYDEEDTNSENETKSGISIAELLKEYT